MNEGVPLQAQACHSGNLHHTVGWDLPQLEQIDTNLQEHYSYLPRTLSVEQLPSLASGRESLLSQSSVAAGFDIRFARRTCAAVRDVTPDMNESLEILGGPTYPSLLCVYLPFCLSTVPLSL